ncbi:3-oxoadipate enol-lactonase [Palleronia sp.]|uniref:3-oxoadipate enol-lactonase n=1 Tax=Palleronia sp. TaxID=1940284 RepID=UPI0035C7ECAD
MSFACIDGTVIHYRYRAGAGLPIVFLNSLGTDFRIWDGVVARLPAGLPLLLMDKPGHGLSQTAPTTMEGYARTVAGLMDHCGLDRALVCGVSIGGMIAQTLALSHPGKVAGLILSNTAAKLGDAQSWQDRLGTLDRVGLEGMADAVLERWFSGRFRTERPVELEGYRAMLTRTPAEGYATACAAISDTDLRERIGGIDVPTLCLAGSDDLASPPEVVHGLASAIPGATCKDIEGVGHLPMIEAPEVVAEALLDHYARLT